MLLYSNFWDAEFYSNKTSKTDATAIIIMSWNNVKAFFPTLFCIKFPHKNKSYDKSLTNIYISPRSTTKICTLTGKNINHFIKVLLSLKKWIRPIILLKSFRTLKLNIMIIVTSCWSIFCVFKKFLIYLYQ